MYSNNATLSCIFIVTLLDKMILKYYRNVGGIVARALDKFEDSNTARHKSFKIII